MPHTVPPHPRTVPPKTLPFFIVFCTTNRVVTTRDGAKIHGVRCAPRPYPSRPSTLYSPYHSKNHSSYLKGKSHKNPSLCMTVFRKICVYTYIYIYNMKGHHVLEWTCMERVKRMPAVPPSGGCRSISLAQVLPACLSTAGNYWPRQAPTWRMPSPLTNPSHLDSKWRGQLTENPHRTSRQCPLHTTYILLDWLALNQNLMAQGQA